MKILQLSAADGGRYDAFLQGRQQSLLYASSRYRRFLERILGARDVSLGAFDAAGELCGVLPCFLSADSGAGRVLNSLPFFGSNGGVLARGDDESIYKQLLGGYRELAEASRCVASTIITSPFEACHDLYRRYLNVDFVDERIGQFTPLPGGEGDVEAALMEGIDAVRRRNIRKAIRSGVTCRVDVSPEAVEYLRRSHIENMRAIGGKPKPDAFFSALGKMFRPEMDYKIYVAHVEGAPVAALLLMYFNGVVEYFVPTIEESCRSLQPLSLLVFEAMQDAARDGFRLWNWGGTWLTQDGVYAFKKKWGTKEHPYYYYVSCSDAREDVLGMTPRELSERYPFFYVVPYGELRPLENNAGTEKS